MKRPPSSGCTSCGNTSAHASWCPEIVADDEIVTATTQEHGPIIARIERPEQICPRCGRPEDSFSCKIRHLALQTGDAKAAKDFG